MKLENQFFIISFFPTFGLFYCLIYPLATDYHVITRTHCKVNERLIFLLILFFFKLYFLN